VARKESDVEVEIILCGNIGDRYQVIEGLF
jgi:hypothetical protein